MSSLQITLRDGRKFDLCGEEPYTRKDGTATVLKVWKATCAVCGTPFKVRTPANVREEYESKAFGRKHCDTHKLSRKEATQRWLKSCNEGKL